MAKTGARPRNAAGSEAKPEWIEVTQLYLDPDNPRLSEGRFTVDDQDAILEALWHEMAVDELVMSIAANGYFAHEPIFAERRADGRLVVVEGNRRLAALKLLTDPATRARVKGGPPQLTNSETDRLRRVPVIVAQRDKVWEYLGFKHVNGPQVWQSHSKARYIAWVHNKLGVSLDDIARHIGDRNDTVKRLYRGLMVLDQAESARVFHRDDRHKSHFAFSHLYTGLDLPGIQAYLGIEPGQYTADPVPKKRIPALGALCTWLYGSKAHDKPPLVQSQNPDLRRLDDVLQSEQGVQALQAGLPLKTAEERAKGDARLFMESLRQAKEALESARGKVLTGYDGDAGGDTLLSAIRKLVDALIEDVERQSQRGGTRVRKPASARGRGRS